MNVRIPFMLTTHSITAVIAGQAYTVANDNPLFGSIKQALQNNEVPQVITELFDRAKAIMSFMRGEVKVVNNVVYYGDQVVNNVVADRILQFMAEGLPHEPLVNFLKKLMDNPSRRSLEYLYKFLEHENLPITPEGNFLAYKAVRSDWKDKHSGTILNTVGTTVEVPRNSVDDDPNAGCSYGLHVGSIGYVRSFGSGSDRYLICEVNPADVVSVPHDCGFQKVRTCKYTVLCEYAGDLPGTLADAKNPYGSNASVSSYDQSDDPDADNDDGDAQETYSNIRDVEECPNCGEDSNSIIVLKDRTAVCGECHYQFKLDGAGAVVDA
jgi:ribosomal protein S27AE